MKTLVNALKDKKTRNKLLATIGILIVYSLGKTIKAPGFNSQAIDVMSNSMLGLLSLLGGGIIERMSLFSLGVGPYINASIIIQLLSSDVIPYLTELVKSGNKKERKRIEYITFCLSLILALFQGYFLVKTLDPYVINHTWKGYMFIAIILTIGSTILYGLSKVIDKYGIGNGMSLIIFAGIVGDYPHQLRNILSMNNIYISVGYVLAFILIMIGVIVVELSERRLPIQTSSSNRMNKTKGSLNHLPIKINTAGVIPVIFASAIIQGPQIVVSWINQNAYQKMNKALSFDNWYMLLIYALLIVMFAFFYANNQFDPKKVANNLSKNNQFIPGLRPGKETEKYIRKVLNSVTCLGAFLLMMLALLPQIIAYISKLNIGLGGTGIIIVVGVAIDLINTLNSDKIQSEYKYRRFF